MELIDAVNAQLKSEIDGAELSNDKKVALKQKYGLIPYLLTEAEIGWYLSLDWRDGGEL